MSDPIRAVDLFCGAGGLSWGLVEALRDVAVEAAEPTEAVLAECIDLVGVNHWKIAIETHERNHPWARHFHDDVQNVNPREVFDADDPDVTILSGGIECTHWSTARGGKPVDEQKRMPAFDFLTWVQKLRPENVLVENVKEFAQWGKIEDGQPTRDGEVFQEWIDSLHALGYNVDWRVLNAADYGDATSRERLFVLARREHQPAFPEPTHSDAGDGDTEPCRTAAEIIDWSEPGESIWTRSRPLVENTMARIAEGIRRHGADRLDPFADAIEDLGRSEVEALQEWVVPARYAPWIAQLREEPFLVAPADAPDTPALCTPYLLGQQSQAVARDATDRPVPTVATDGYIRLFDADTFVLPRNQYHRGLHSNRTYAPNERPLHTVTAKNHDGHLVDPTLLRFSHGGALVDTDAPLPTITTAKGGVFAVSQPRPYLVPYYSERSGQRPRVHPITEPYPTVTATGSDPYLAKPYLVKYYGRSDAQQTLDRPLATVRTENTFGVADPYLIHYHGQSGALPVGEPAPSLTTRDSLALCAPDLYPWGLDVRFRMLQPRELAAAQGFPEDYDFAGTKTETVEQIGNAVPVNLARQLVASLLQSETPALTDFLDESPAETGGIASDD